MSRFTGASRTTQRGALGSPATPQQVINTRGHIDRLLVRRALLNSGDHVRQSRAYPGGGIKDHHVIMPHDVTIGQRHQKVVQRLLNHPNLKVIASFNGMTITDFPTDNHIARAFMFTGVALDSESYDANRKDSGLALQIGGIYTIKNTGMYTLKPGQMAKWSPPPTNRGIPGGRPMSQVPQATFVVGDPRQKLVPIIEPYDPMDMGGAMTAAMATMFRSAQLPETGSPGILGAPYRQLYQADVVGELRRNTSHQDEAMAIKFGLFPLCLRVIFGLIDMGLLQGGAGGTGTEVAGNTLRAIVRRTGLFETNPTTAQTTQLRTVMAYLFGNHSPAVKVAGNVEARIRGQFPAGYDRRQQPVQGDFFTEDANIARALADALPLTAGLINNAAQEERANILGKVLNNAMPGEGAAVCFGMRNN